VVGFTIGSRGEVPAKRKPVIKDHDDDDDDGIQISSFTAACQLQKPLTGKH
jgi:hypothetical protein